jgi:hypothetical protein
VANGQLSVGAFEITAVVPRDQRPLPWLTGDLTEMVPRLVVPRLIEALKSGLPDGDGSVWLIRELNVDLAVAARWPADRIADRIAAAIIAAIQKAVHGPGEPGVVRLPDRAEHLAAVLRDVAAGGGARWLHGGWADAVALPRTEALAALLCRAGDDGPLALVRTGASVAERIIRLLRNETATALARAWGLTGPADAASATAPATAAIEQVSAHLPRALLADRPRVDLLLLALAGVESPEIPIKALAAAIRAVTNPFGPITMARPASTQDPWAKGTDVTVPGANETPMDERAIRWTLPKAKSPASDSPAFATFTAEAALFMLWRSAIESGALDHAAAIAGDPGSGAAMLARALSGAARDPALDPAIQRLSRVGEEDIAAPPAQITLAALLDAMRTDDWRKPAVTHAVLEVARVPVQVAPLGQVTILADAATGLWLWLWPGTLPTAQELLDRIGPAVALLLDCNVAGQIGAPWPREPADEGRVWLLPLEASLPVSNPPLRHLPGRLSRDLDALMGEALLATLADSEEASLQDALSWACLGQRVFRDLARRLPGFTHAGPEWLRANILPRSASVVLSETRDGPELTVTAEPPALAMLSRIVGLVPRRYMLPGQPRLAVNLEFASR